MISDIAHDIRTPLTAIIGYVDLLRDDGLEVTREKEYVDIIHERGNALKELIEEFFQMAKLECNDVELKTGKVNISEIIRQNIITFMKEISEKHMEPDMELGEEEIYVLADRNALSRVVTNLISNSLKYGYEGRVIGIELKACGGCAEMTVWDRGKGIGKSKIPFIFERLYTEEGSRNRMLQGSGLGLAIVKRLVEYMGGNITVDSIPYEKTSFTLTLPLYKEG